MNSKSSSLNYTGYTEWKISCCIRYQNPCHISIMQSFIWMSASPLLINFNNKPPMIGNQLEYKYMMSTLYKLTQNTTLVWHFSFHISGNATAISQGRLEGFYFFPPGAPTERLAHNSNTEAVRDGVSCSWVQLEVCVHARRQRLGPGSSRCWRTSPSIKPDCCQ